MPSDQELTTALQAALEAVLEMPERGVTSPHVIPTALVMVALPLLEATTSRAAIAIWLQELADAYDEKGEEGLGEDPENDDDEDGADAEEAGVELDPADDEPDPDDEPADEPER